MMGQHASFGAARLALLILFVVLAGGSYLFFDLRAAREFLLLVRR
jgi:hypothetical protein